MTPLHGHYVPYVLSPQSSVRPHTSSVLCGLSKHLLLDSCYNPLVRLRAARTQPRRATGIKALLMLVTWGALF